MKVFVTGATGYIGRYLVNNLLHDDYEVYALTRREQIDPPLDPRIKFIIGDVTKELQLPNDIEVIFNCAGVIDQNELMYDVNVIGTANVVKAALDNDCLLVQLSSAGVVGNTDAQIVNENTECNPVSVYERSKYDAEKIIHAGIDRGLKCQILRPTIIFGMGRDPKKDSFLHLVRAITNGRYLSIGNGIYNIVHAQDVVKALRVLENRELVNGGTFLINNSVPFKDFTSLVTRQFPERNHKVRSVPFSLASIAAFAFTVIGKVTGKNLPLTTSRLKALTNTQRFSQDKILQNTSFQPDRNIEQHVTSVVIGYKESGLL